MKDKCVTCGIDSVFDRDEHIKFRIGYIIGVGQLCLDCLGRIYYPKEINKTKSKGNVNEKRKMVRLR
tara:strand:- start:251 stop:451 length:201 start_codon:yes stop_codon:yes gene_type:complete